MKIIHEDKPFKFVRFELQDFKKYYDKINNDFAFIFASSSIGDPDSNRQEALEKMGDFMTDALYDDMGCFVYFVYDDNNLPISVVVYTENNHHYHLEIISTNEEYKCNGYASELCLKSFEDLANNFDVELVTATVSKENYPSLCLQESLTRNEKIKFETFSDVHRIGYRYYIDGLVKTPKMSA